MLTLVNKLVKQFLSVISTIEQPCLTLHVFYPWLLISGPQTVTCDFDIDLCAWKQSTTDNFDWSLQSGPTLTTQTGPSADHSSGSE